QLYRNFQTVLDWLGTVGIFLLLFLLYRNKLQFTGWYRSKKQATFRKEITLTISILGVACSPVVASKLRNRLITVLRCRSTRDAVVLIDPESRKCSIVVITSSNSPAGSWFRPARKLSGKSGSNVDSVSEIAAGQRVSMLINSGASGWYSSSLVSAATALGTVAKPLIRLAYPPAYA